MPHPHFWLLLRPWSHGYRLAYIDLRKRKMRTLSEILLPTDFSPRSVDVVRFAAIVAQHFNATMTLLHVLLPVNPTWIAMGNAELVDKVITHTKEEACGRLERFLSNELRGLRVKRLVAEGDPAQVITEYVAAEQVGLIMMPTRGCSAFRRFLLGSVTAKVLHDAACPVWTSSHITDKFSSIAMVPRVIVCAVDVNAEGRAVLHWAADLASNLEARLIVVHAIPSLEFHPESYFLEADMRKSVVGDARSKVSKMLQSSYMPDAEIRVEGGNIATVVRSVVEDSKAELLVIGRASGKGMLGRLRTHSYSLIRESPCPVISV
jgi:nucleotide-binding universal stress UspA family protein